MKFFSAAITASAIALSTLSSANAQQTQPRCSSIVTRKEILSLSSSEWDLVKGVYAGMQRDGWFQWFAYLHNTWFGQIHGNSQFFPFHRRFVQDWESVGQRYNRAFAQPYWDEMRDYRVPASSQVLTSAWVGGNGQSNNCVTNGVQANWQMTYPNAHCLRRQFGNNGNPTSWYSPEYIQSFIQRDTTMAQFRPDLEYSLHGVVHINIGGDMYQTYSPNDVIFWLHHANLDRIWWQWQNVVSSNGARNNMWRMDGPNFDNSAISLSSNVVAYNEPINTVMQLGYGKMCFQYTNAPGPASAMSRRSGSTDLVNSVASGITNLISNVASTLNSDKALLEKWFPKTAEEVANHSIVPVAALWAGNKKEIPYPATLTPQWIAMHKFKQAEVQRVENDARQFVNDMKKVGYKSPY